MADQLDKAVKRERAKRASAAAREAARDYRRSCVGRTLEVLFEREEDGLSGRHRMSVGHAGNYQEVAAPGTELRNRRLNVRIQGEKSGILLGESRTP